MSQLIKDISRVLHIDSTSIITIISECWLNDSEFAIEFVGQSLQNRYKLSDIFE